MKKLTDCIGTYFRMLEGADNLPSMARPRSRGGRTALANVMRDMGVQTGIEIGTRNGDSAELWCTHIPGLQLTCIDPYLAYPVRTSQDKQNQVHDEAVERLAQYDIQLLREKSQDVADRFEEASVDFVYIDGDHTFDAAVMDIVQYVPKVREGGLILIHDYCAFKLSGVIQAIDGYTHCHKIDPWYVTKDNNPTVFWARGSENA